VSLVHEALKKAEKEAGSFRPTADPAGSRSEAQTGLRKRGLLLILLLSVVAVAGLLFFSFRTPSSLNEPATRSAAASPEGSPPALQSNEEQAGVRVEQGLAYYREGQVSRAELAFRGAVRVAPNLAVAHNNLGLVLKKQGRLEEARSEYDQAIRINPRYAEALQNLGVVYDRLGRPQEAIADYRHALELDSSLAEAHYHLGSALERAGDREGAKREYRVFLLQSKRGEGPQVEAIRRHLQELEQG